MYTKKLALFSILLGSIALVGCATQPKPMPPEKNDVVKDMPLPDKESITDIVVATEDVSILKEIVILLDLGDTLSSAGPFTVFAPTNDAFEKLLVELDLSFEELASDKELLQTIIEYHVLDSEVQASAVMSMNDQTAVKTLGGESFTVFNQNGVKVNESTVVVTDIIASNGVIHLIDTVLIPPSLRDSLGGDVAQNIVTTAIESENFPTLVAAIQAAGLVETLSSEGPFTVFAPTEEAFAQLLDALEITAEDLLADTELLTTVLTYHVIPGEYSAEDVSGLGSATSFTTVQGSAVSIDPNNGSPTINNSKIVQTDILTSNGIIHVIDTVLVPGG